MMMRTSGTVDRDNPGDLFGPIVFPYWIAVSLIKRYPTERPSRTFEQVYSAILLGAVLISITAMGLGAKTGFLQLFSLLGYSFMPFFISSMFLWLSGATKGGFMSTILGIVSIVWSMLIMTVFLAALVSKKRLVLALYPVLLLNLYLFYVIIV